MMRMAATCQPTTKERRPRSPCRTRRRRCRCRHGRHPARQPPELPRGPVRGRQRRCPGPPFPRIDRPPRPFPASTWTVRRQVRDGPPPAIDLNLEHEEDAAVRLLGERQGDNLAGRDLGRVRDDQVWPHRRVGFNRRHRPSATGVRAASRRTPAGDHGARGRQDHHRKEHARPSLHGTRTDRRARMFPQSGSTTRKESSSSCFGSIGDGAPIMRSVPDCVFGKAMTSRMLSTSAKSAAHRSRPMAIPP